MTDTLLLNYSASGAGMPVVLLHGFPLSSEIWSKQRLALSKHFLVVTPDLRGHGLSRATEGVYEMDLMARDVLALLDFLRISKAVIVGHSMGGYVALAAWRQSPCRFLGLGLIGSQAGADSPEVAQNRLKTAEQVGQEGSGTFLRSILPKFFSPVLPANSPLMELTKKIIVETPAISIIGSLKGMASRKGLDAELANIDIPVLILSGDKDQLIPVTVASAMAATIRDCHLKIISKSGHLPMLENPESTTIAMDEFLSTIQWGNQSCKGLPPINDGTAAYS